MLPAELKIRIPATTVRHHHLYLAADEYQSNTDMQALASAHIGDHGPRDPHSPLMVTVWEHGGWFESFVLLTVGNESRVCRVQTANEKAQYPAEVDAVRMMFGTYPVKPEARTHWRRRPARAGGGYYPA